MGDLINLKNDYIAKVNNQKFKREDLLNNYIEDLFGQANDIVQKAQMEKGVKGMVDLMATVYQEMIYQGFDEVQAYDFTKEYILNMAFNN